MLTLHTFFCIFCKFRELGCVLGGIEFYCLVVVNIAVTLNQIKSDYLLERLVLPLLFSCVVVSRVVVNLKNSFGTGADDYESVFECSGLP